MSEYMTDRCRRYTALPQALSNSKPATDVAIVGTALIRATILGVSRTRFTCREQIAYLRPIHIILADQALLADRLA